MATVTYNIDNSGSGMLDQKVAPGTTSTAYSVDHLTDGSLLTAFVSGATPLYVEGIVHNKVFNLATTPLHETSPQVAGLAGGGAVAVFDELGQGVSATKAHIFDAKGNPVADDFFMSNTDFAPQINPDVASLNDGGFVVGWERLTSAFDHDIHAKVFNADGSSRADVIIAAASNNETNPALTSLANNGFAAAWVKHVGANTELWTARYDANGNIQGSATQVDHFGSINDQPQIVGLQNGGYAIAYRDNGWGANTDISVAIYDANGTQQKIIEANIGHTAGDQVTPSITTLSNGFIAVGWTNSGPQVSSDFAVFDQNGNLLLNNASPYLPGENSTMLSGGPGGALEFVDHDAALNTVYVAHDTFERHTTGDGSGETIIGDSLPDVVIAMGGNDTVYGGDGNDYIDGGDGVDHLYGGDGFDILHGGANDDVLYGGAGQDGMYGGTGNDTYYVDNALDQVLEAPNEGIDLVYSSVGFTLPDNVEKLALQPGAGAANGTGNGLDNVISGNNSDNVLSGLDGNDTLKGLGGNDTIDGGTGDDTAVYSGTRFDYHIAQLVNGDLQIVDLRPGSPDGADTVHAVEHFAFSDGTVTAAALMTPPSVHWAASVDVGNHPAGYQPVAFGDFNGDGTSDALWFNPANNNVDLWTLSTGRWSGSSDLGSHPAGCQVAGTGDFNHDGTSDVLWFNPATNDAEVWMIQNGHWAGSSDIGTHPADSQIAGVGDFNGDGTSDVLWYNPATNDAEVWTIQNGHWTASTDIGTHPAGFQIAGVGDFNHDGTSDVLWFNQATGETDLWMINNGHWASSSNLGAHPAGYQPAAVGDFAHDGNADILWYNAASGDTDLWKMFDGHWAGSDSLGAHPAGWQAAGAGDFNHDGVADVAWFNAASNHMEEWILGNS